MEEFFSIIFGVKSDKVFFESSNPLIKANKFSEFFSCFGSVKNAFTEFKTGTLFSSDEHLSEFFTSTCNLLKEDKIVEFYSFTRPLRNSVMVDLNYYRKVYSYNQHLVDNIEILFNKFKTYCSINNLEVTDRFFNKFLSDFDKRGLDLNG